jgi:hypothetical protein
MRGEVIVENHQFTKREQGYIDGIKKIRERSEDRHIFKKSIGSYVIATPGRILWDFVGILIVIAFFTGAILWSGKTFTSIICLGGFGSLLLLLMVNTTIGDIRIWKFIKKIKKDEADRFNLATDYSPTTGTPRYFVGYVVEFSFMKPMVKTEDLTKEEYDLINGLTYLPIRLVAGKDMFVYKVDFKKINKLNK